MSKFGDLLGGKTAPAATPPAPEPVVKAPAPPKPAPVVSKSAPLKEELFKESKDELEQIGRGIGIELDRRQSHSKLVVQLQAELEKKKVILD